MPPEDKTRKRTDGLNHPLNVLNSSHSHQNTKQENNVQTWTKI